MGMPGPVSRSSYEPSEWRGVPLSCQAILTPATTQSLGRSPTLDAISLSRSSTTTAPNYEGRKVLLFEGVSLEELKAQRKIDPHFFPSGPLKSPIARFEPTERGWTMAELLVSALHRQSLLTNTTHVK
jgi:hypothetical protein